MYAIDDFEVALGGKHLVINGACVAEVVKGEYKFAFATFPREMNQGNDQYAGVIIGQATSSRWKFKVRTGSLVMSSAASPGITLTIENTLFDDDMIMFNIGGHGQQPPELKVFVTTAVGEISLSGEVGKVLATFPADGASVVYSKLLDCGGIK